MGPSSQKQKCTELLLAWYKPGIPLLSPCCLISPPTVCSSPSFSSFCIAHKKQAPAPHCFWIIFVTLSTLFCHLVCSHMYASRRSLFWCASAPHTATYVYPLYCFTSVSCRLFKICRSSLQISSFCIFFQHLSCCLFKFCPLSSSIVFSTPIFLRAILAASQLPFPSHVFFFVALTRIIVHDVAVNPFRRMASLTRFPLRLSRTSSDVFSKQSGVVEGCGWFR